MHFPEIKIPNVADTTVEYFEELILSGVLTPGLILPSERKLSERLEISRTSLRTAYNKLEAKGLIERKPQGVLVRGIFDVLISQPLNELFYVDKEELFEMWQVLFGASLATCCTRRTNQDLANLNDVSRRIHDYDKARGAEELSNLISEFFTAISSTTYNFLLYQILNVVNQTLKAAFVEIAREALANKSKKALLESHLSGLITALERSDTDMASREFSQFSGWCEQCNLKRSPRASQPETKGIVEVTAPSAHAMAKISKTLTSGNFKVGDVLPSADTLSKQLQITPASIRGALARLETLGVVEIGKKDQAVIKSLTIQETKDPLLEVLVKNQRHLEAVIEFRIILEEQTAFLAAKRCTEELLPKLRKKLDLLEEKFNLNDGQDYAHLDIDFHKTIASLSGNGGLWVITSALVNFFETATGRWLNIYHELTGGFSVIHDQHIAIYEAIAARKPVEAMREMNEHLSYVIKMTRSFNDIEHREDIAVLRESLRASSAAE